MSKALKLIDKLISEHREAIDQLIELKRSLAHIEQKKVDGPGTSPKLSFSREDTQALEAALTNAKECNELTFMFKGNEFVVGYAEYLLKYLKERFSAA